LVVEFQKIATVECADLAAGRARLDHGGQHQGAQSFQRPCLPGSELARHLAGGLTIGRYDRRHEASLCRGLAGRPAPLGRGRPDHGLRLPDPGTTFTYDSGTKVVAKGRDGMDCTMEIVGGKPYKLRALLFDNPSPDGRDTTAFINALKPERLWPLDVGKKIEAATAPAARPGTTS
jgi:hypothetical protein